MINELANLWQDVTLVNGLLNVQTTLAMGIGMLRRSVEIVQIHPLA